MERFGEEKHEPKEGKVGTDLEKMVGPNRPSHTKSLFGDFTSAKLSALHQGIKALPFCLFDSSKFSATHRQ